MRWKVLSSLAAVGALGVVSAPEPVGACSLWCPGEVLEVVRAEVVVVDGDPEADPPDWAASGTLEGDLDGTPYVLVLRGGPTLHLQPAVGE